MSNFELRSTEWTRESSGLVCNGGPDPDRCNLHHLAVDDVTVAFMMGIDEGCGFPQRPGRQGKVLWSALQIVKLAFMAEVVRLGIPPRVALGLSAQLEERAIRVHADHPVEEDDGRLSWPIADDHQERYQRGYIFLDGSRHQMIIHGRDLGRYRALLPAVYITVECDRIVITCLSRIYAVAAGVDLLAGRSLLDDEADAYYRTRLWLAFEAEGRP